MAGFLGAALLIKPVQDRLDSRLPRDPVDPDLLYFSSPPVVKALALGYDSLLADIYWMRAIQYYGRRDEAARRQIRYKNLPALLDIVTTLDPKMIDVYRAGSIFLAEPDPVGAGLPDAAIKLLEKGISCQPQEWRLWFDKGFVYFWHVKDFNQAGRVWLEGSRLKTAPRWMEALAASALSRGGAVDIARELWRRQLEDSTREDVRVNARNHLASIQVDEDIWSLEFFVELYAGRNGSLPPRLESLVLGGLLRYVPKDPSGAPYEYEPSSGKVRLGPDSKVRYLALPYDYRESFRARLAQQFGTKRKPQ
jgi:tetratricopeptide (TPR) repeat protein